jgi:FkbM family methyltransferase
MLTALELQKPYGAYALSGYKRTLLLCAHSLGNSWLAHLLGLYVHRLVLQEKPPLVDAEALGIKARFSVLNEPRDSRFLFLPDFCYSVEFPLLSQFLHPDSVFVDGGAKIGLFSLWAAKRIQRTGHILSLETDPTEFKNLIFNVSLNNKSGVVVPLFMGKTEDTTSSDTEHSILNAVSYQSYGGSKTKNSPNPLLSIMHKQGLEKIDVLKIDPACEKLIALPSFFEMAPLRLYPRLIFIRAGCPVDFHRLGYTFLGRTDAGNCIYKLGAEGLIK